MKKILVLVGVLALVAALVVPMTVFAAGSTSNGPVNVNVGGQVPAVPSQLNMQTPSDIGTWSTSSWTGNTLGWLVVGNNYGSATPGSVTFVQGNDGMTGWNVTLTLPVNYAAGKMWSATVPTPNDFLPNVLQLSFDNGTTLYPANTAGLQWNGPADAALPLYAEQVVGTTDKAGVYSIVLVYTLTPQY